MSDVRDRLRTAPARPLGVTGRLTILLAGLTGLSLLLSYTLQSRRLEQDIERSATTRLEQASRTAGWLIQDHLRRTLERFEAVSLTPEFRANLEAAHRETLEYYATRLRDRTSAAAISFLDSGSRAIATSGSTELVRRATEDQANKVAKAEHACLGLSRRRDGADPAADRGLELQACRYPAEGAEATLLAFEGQFYTVTMVPLKSGTRLVGGLAAIEPVAPASFREWSSLSGATVGPTGARTSDAEVTAPVRGFETLALTATTTYDVELAVLERLRGNLTAAATVVLLISIVGSAILARGFARPIVQMRFATERLSEGHTDEPLDLRRGDEIGQLARAFDAMVSRLSESQDRLRRVQRMARFGNWYFDPDLERINGTSEFRRLFGLPADSAPIGLPELLDRVHPDDRRSLESALERCVKGASLRVDVRVRRHEDRYRILHLRGEHRSTSDASRRIEASAQDVTERRTAEEQIRYLSLYDPLTGLGNREYLRQRLEIRCQQAKRSRRPCSVLMVGLDGFQEINDSLGRAACDAILTEVGERIADAVAAERGQAEAAVERSDVTVRIEGDRFAVLLEDLTDGRKVGRFARSILRNIGAPFESEGREVTLTASIGITRWPRDTDDIDTLLGNCETALHRGKQAGPGGFRFFERAMHKDATHRLQLTDALRGAIRDGRIDVHYQPRVRPESGELVGFEALARWHDPVLGRVGPAVFIDVAERTGLIQPLGDHCLVTAIGQLREWREKGVDGLCISINVSGLQLVSGFDRRILDLTDGLDRGCIELEVTETVLMEEADEALAILTALRAEGVKVGLDDFGTGYSSLAHLQELPIDTVKIDQRFIRRVADDPEGAGLTSSIVSLCRALGLHTVAEGVETEEQLDILRRMGCDEVQGFFFGEPMPAEEALALLKRQEATGACPIADGWLANA